MLTSSKCQIYKNKFLNDKNKELQWKITIMFINKAKDGLNNICGKNIACIRIKLHVSQRAIADFLQLHGLDVDKNAIQRIESGKRFVTDIELVIISKALKVSLEDLVKET